MKQRFFLVLAALALTWAAAQHDHAAPEAAYTLTGDVLDGPTELSAGYHLFTFGHDGEGYADIMVVRLLEGATPEDIVAHFSAVDASFGPEGDPVAAFNAALEDGEPWGGPSLEGPGRASVGIELPAGRYAVVASYYAGEMAEDAPPAPASYATLELSVMGGDAAEAPQADVVVQMVEFAFALPPDIQAGEQVWEVVNAGEQLHHLSLVRIREGFTMDDVMAYGESFEGEEPTELVGYIAIVSPGVSNFVTFDLTPGTYLAMCFIPDHGEGGDGAPHFVHGMMQTFVVGD